VAIAGGTGSVKIISSRTASGGAIAGGTGSVKIISSRTASGGVIADGAGSTKIRSWNVATGGSIAGGISSTKIRSWNVATGGAVAGGTAHCTFQRTNWYYESNGGIVIAGTSKTKPLGFYYVTANGGIIIGSETRSVSGRIHVSSGGITMSGTNQPTQATYKYVPQGRKNILVRGSAVTLPGHLKYVASGGIIVYGKSDVEYNLSDEICNNAIIGCRIPKPNKRNICLTEDYYYADCKGKCSRALLPSIVKCRQKIIVPKTKKNIS